eukprot:SAG31_NODE_751_length_12354_cov_14.018605_9_plen_69_part_00
MERDVFFSFSYYGIAIQHCHDGSYFGFVETLGYARCKVANSASEIRTKLPCLGASFVKFPFGIVMCGP